MKFIQILFSTPMVQSILEGRKTQTRRVVKPQPPNDFEYLGTDTDNSSGQSIFYACWEGSTFHNVKCPYGQPGDILWVREKSCYVHLEHAHDLLEGFREKRQIIYGTDMHDDWMKYAKEKYGYKWTPSLFMAKHHCRIFLKISNVRVERLQDISEGDAEREGINIVEHNCYENYIIEKDWQYDGMNQKGFHMIENPIGSFASLWAKINGEQSWEDNPWVWVIEFERCGTPLNFLSNGI